MKLAVTSVAGSHLCIPFPRLDYHVGAEPQLQPLAHLHLALRIGRKPISTNGNRNASLLTVELTLQRSRAGGFHSAGRPCEGFLDHQRLI